MCGSPFWEPLSFIDERQGHMLPNLFEVELQGQTRMARCPDFLAKFPLWFISILWAISEGTQLEVTISFSTAHVHGPPAWQCVGAQLQRGD